MANGVVDKMFRAGEVSWQAEVSRPLIETTERLLDPVNPQHYKRNAIEPWDYVAANELGYFEGSAIKYITRWKYKNGVTDLKKAVAFINKLIDLEERRRVRSSRGAGRSPQCGRCQGW